MIVAFYFSLVHLLQSCTLTESPCLAAAKGSHSMSLVPASFPVPGLVGMQQSSESNVGTHLSENCLLLILLLAYSQINFPRQLTVHIYDHTGLAGKSNEM